MAINQNKLIDFEDQVNHCSKCGYCQSVCPIFQTIKTESSVPRGKVALIKGVLNGDLEYTPNIAKYLEMCTGCLACSDFCPSGVSLDKLFIAAKEHSAKTFGLSLPKQAIDHAFSSEKTLHFFSTLLNLYAFSHIDKINNKLPNQFPFIEKIRLLNNQLKNKSQYNYDDYKIENKKPAFNLIYFPGCINKYVNASVISSGIKFLSKNNCDIYVPKGLYCCGKPAKSIGAIETAQILAKKNLKILAESNLLNFDYIITDCASCGSMLKSYCTLFREGSLEFNQAELIQKKLVDINVIISKLNLSNLESKENTIITYHDPCHLRRGQGIYKEPRHILSNIKNVQYTELNEADTCCGAAGSFCVTNSNLSTNISTRKADNITKTKANIVLTSCPSCKVGLSQGLLTNNQLIEILHPIEFICKLQSL